MEIINGTLEITDPFRLDLRFLEILLGSGLGTSQQLAPNGTFREHESGSR